MWTCCIQIQKDVDEMTLKDKTGEDSEAVDLPAADAVAAVVEGWLAHHHRQYSARLSWTDASWSSERYCQKHLSNPCTTRCHRAVDVFFPMLVSVKRMLATCVKKLNKLTINIRLVDVINLAFRWKSSCLYERYLFCIFVVHFPGSRFVQEFVYFGKELVILAPFASTYNLQMLSHRVQLLWADNGFSWLDFSNHSRLQIINPETLQMCRNITAFRIGVSTQVGSTKVNHGLGNWTFVLSNHNYV